LPRDAAELIRLGRTNRRRGDHLAARQYFEAAVAVAPENLAAAVEIGTTLRELDQLDEAEARYRAVLDHAPGYVAALNGLAELAQRRGDTFAALDWFERAAVADPGNPIAQFHVGRTLLSLGRVDEAEMQFRRVVEDSPGHPGALTYLAQIARQRGDLSAALAFYERAASSDPSRVIVQIGMAGTLRDLARFDEAEKRYRAVLERWPSHALCLEGLGDIAQGRGDLAAALVWFEAAAAGERPSLSVQLKRGRVLQALGRFAAAEACYRTVLTQVPGHAGALVGLGEAARLQGDLGGALSRFQAAAASESDQPGLQIRIAQTLLELLRHDEAEACYRRVLERWPGHAPCLEGLGDIAQRRGDLAASLVWYEAAAAGERVSLSVQLKIGRVLQALGRFEAAEACYRTMLEQVPNHAGALVGLGETARLQGDLGGALRRFQAAAASEPEKPGVQIRIAEILSELLRLDEAEAAFRSLLQAFPDDVRALIGLGSVELKRGENAAALALFETAVAKAPEDRDPWFHLVPALRGLCRIREAEAILERIGEFAEGNDTKLQTRRFEHFCLTLQLAEAEKCLRAWGGHRDVPSGAVVFALGLYAALGRWSDVLRFCRERVVEGEWIGAYDKIVEPLARAGRATGRYAEVCELFERLPGASTNAALRLAREQIVEEIRLLQLLDPRRPAPRKAIDTRLLTDPFRARRAELFARVLEGQRPVRPRTEIFTCTDGAYLIGATVSLFSLLKHNMGSLRDCRFTVFCADDVLDLGSTVFGDIGAAFAKPIDVRPSSSLFSKELDLRTGWGIFTPGHRLSQAAYYRIYAAKRLIDEGATGRALYIDADTCVYSGIDRLVAFDLAGQPVGARLDEEVNPAIRRAVILLGLEPGTYFNSGVLVFDLSHPGLLPALEQAIKISLTEQHRLTFVDQCALNLAFRNKFTALPDRFNLFIRSDTCVEALLGDATVVHFLDRPKPWDPMYGTPNCMPWLGEFAAMADVLAPDLTKRLLALHYPAIADAAPRRRGPPRSRSRPKRTPRRQVEIVMEEPLLLARIAGCAHALLDAGHLDEAERLYQAIAECIPAASAGHVGLARTAMRRERWEEAVARWDAVFARFADRSVSHWMIARATAQTKLGRWAEAITSWNAAITTSGDRAEPDWIAARATAQVRLGCAAVALRLLEASAFDTIEHPRLFRARLECLIALRRLPEARAIFAQAIGGSKDPAVLTSLLEFAARLFEGWSRTDTFLALLERANLLESSCAHGADSQITALRLRLLLALRNYEGFLRTFDSVADARRFGAHQSDLKAVAAALRRPRSVDYRMPKVFGIGLSRTGTTSLAAAMSALGFSTAKWINRLTGEVIGEDDFHLFDAFVDTPACINFERNYYTFPNSKFIYTVRSPSDWEHSWSAYSRRRWLLSDFREMADKIMERDQFEWGRLFADIHMALYFNHGSYAEAFRIYDRRVRRFFADKPTERFLQLDLFAGDGWEKLCRFLEREVPAVPFPWKNRAPTAAPSGGCRRGPNSEEKMTTAAITITLANGRRVAFEVDRGGAGPASFVLGLSKCGSSLLNMLAQQLAKLNDRWFIDVGGKFFFENVLESDWKNDPGIGDLLYGGNVYGGLRAVPTAMAGHPTFRDGPKILLVRDPRDALVSLYFSDAYSHPIPARTEAASPTTDLMERLRRDALNSGIDDFVLRRAVWMRRDFLSYLGVARRPETMVVRYEDYIFRKPELVRLIARQFGLTVEDAQIDEMMIWADLRPATEDPSAFVRRVTPGDHRNKLRPETIAALDELLQPAMEAFGYPLE
jgi:tetratricopeptide (TPR) repeat protein/lipopolysaccharide biosynthesis glycosyltransferase